METDWLRALEAFALLLTIVGVGVVIIGVIFLAAKVLGWWR